MTHPPTPRDRPKFLRRVGACAWIPVLLALLGACSGLRPTPRPMPQALDLAPCEAIPGANRPLVVMLPGRGMSLRELEQQGFIDAVRRRGFDVDLLRVDAHLGYYEERSVFELLREEVVAPARERGARQVWLTGISLGGYGALLYDARHPGEISGVVALAPYLGLDEVVRDVAAAGGVLAWRAPPLDRFGPASTPADTDRHLWRWLQSQAGAAPAGDARRVPVFLGYGDSDRFNVAQGLAAAALAPDRVVVRPGGHDWPAWRAAWDALLERMPWPRREACMRAASVPPGR